MDATYLLDYEPLCAIAVERGPVDAAELIGPVDQAVHGVVPDGDGGPGLAGRGVVAPVAVVHVDHDVGEVGRVEADLADVVPLGQKEHRGEFVPAGRVGKYESVG